MKVAIIAAMDKEIIKYKELFNLKLVNNILNIYEGNYKNIGIILSLCGIGKVNSAADTQYLIDNYKIDFIINSGCCGSLIESVKVLDVVLASYVTYHDFNPIRIMEIATPENGKISCDKTLLDKVTNILNEKNINFHIGGICSGDCFVTDSNMRDDILNRTNCIAVDMESASIGHVCKKNNVPFIIIRSISDFADGASEQEEQAATISACIVRNLLDSLN